MSLALAYDSKGLQGGKTKYPSLGRFNPIHVMLRTGTDAYSGVLGHRKIRGADDIIMPCNAARNGTGSATSCHACFKTPAARAPQHEGKLTFLVLRRPRERPSRRTIGEAARIESK